MNPMKWKIGIALVAILSTHAFGAIPTELPKLMNKEELAVFREELKERYGKTEEKSKTGLDPELQHQIENTFYTGKPYLPTTGTYAFKYREYNPTLARWTSEDPSGFPDGANNSYYAPTPTSEFDYMGLETQAINETLPLNIFKDKITSILEKAPNLANINLMTLIASVVLKIDTFDPKYKGEYQWNTSEHTLKVNDNPGQEGLSSATLGLTGGGSLSIGVEFKFYTPNPEKGINPATGQEAWHYQAEGFWMLTLSGIVGGSWEIHRPSSAKLDQWHE